jgi:hypothetical protein
VFLTPQTSVTLAVGFPVQWVPGQIESVFLMVCSVDPASQLVLVRVPGGVSISTALVQTARTGTCTEPRRIGTIADSDHRCTRTSTSTCSDKKKWGSLYLVRTPWYYSLRTRIDSTFVRGYKIDFAAASLFQAIYWNEDMNKLIHIAYQYVANKV